MGEFTSIGKNGGSGMGGYPEKRDVGGGRGGLGRKWSNGRNTVRRLKKATRLNAQGESRKNGNKTVTRRARRIEVRRETSWGEPKNRVTFYSKSKKKTRGKESSSFEEKEAGGVRT